ncbi:MAG: hypothetical protein EXQ49_03930 [Acidobacteria bacterium]|nr:hypothetical protein [Acidobacteriota bacterium]
MRVFYEGPMLEPMRPGKVVELKPGIMYVDLSRTTADDFRAAIPALGAAQGIVFDIRDIPILDVRDVLPLLSEGEVRLELASQVGATTAFRAGLPLASFPALAEAVWFAPPSKARGQR